MRSRREAREHSPESSAEGNPWLGWRGRSSLAGTCGRARPIPRAAFGRSVVPRVCYGIATAEVWTVWLVLRSYSACIPLVFRLRTCEPQSRLGGTRRPVADRGTTAWAAFQKGIASPKPGRADRVSRGNLQQLLWRVGLIAALGLVADRFNAFGFDLGSVVAPFRVLADVGQHRGDLFVGQGVFRGTLAPL